MGSDPKKFAFNQYCQAWEVKNLFVTDGGSFASNAAIPILLNRNAIPPTPVLRS